MSGRWGKGEENGEEGVLEEDGLPEFTTELFVEDGGVGADDVGIAVEAHGVCLSD